MTKMNKQFPCKHEELDFSLVLASSVHDMKNSLGMLLTSLEKIIDSRSDEQNEESGEFSVLQYEASRINSELIQLLNIYRMQQNHLPFNLDENYLIETFEDQLARNHTLMHIKNIDVTMDCDPDLAWFYDNELIGNVIHNVLINAARYAKDSIKLCAYILDEQLVMNIEDDGAGFPGFMLKSDPLEVRSGTEANSTQLGLFFAGKIASLHRKNDKCGRIELSNGGSLGGGVFSIYLP